MYKLNVDMETMIERVTLKVVAPSKHWAFWIVKTEQKPTQMRKQMVGSDAASTSSKP